MFWRIFFYSSLICFLLTFILNSNVPPIRDDPQLNSSLNFVTVNTRSGPIRGRILNTMYENRRYYSFQGIPYAQPPIDRLRFLPPRPVEPWTRVRDAFHFGNMCMQKNVTTHKTIGDEDCLFLDIYTPAIKSTSTLPVMFYIHGGAWYCGSGSVLGPDFLINENVILVTINYRLSVFGFMSLGSPEYSGSQGFKDQQMALKWINANIEHFGGDRNCVTIFGDSAGTVSSIYHIAAPESKGLFQRSIEISSSFDMWGLYIKKHHRADMLQFAQKTNASIATYTDLVELLLRTKADVLLTSFPFTFFRNTIMPTLENANALEPFHQATPKELLLEADYNSDVDIMTGFTTGEALFLARTNKLQHDIDNLIVQLPNIHFNMEFKSPEYLEAINEIRDYYFPNSTERKLENIVRLKSDVYQRYFIDRRIKLLAEKSAGRTYYYRFALETKLNYFKIVIGAETRFGASHGDDLCYIGPCNFSKTSLAVYPEITTDSHEYKLIKTMSGLYANFAKYGRPLPNTGSVYLKPVRPGYYPFLDITNDGLALGEDPLREESAFWDKLISNHPNLFTLHNY